MSVAGTALSLGELSEAAGAVVRRIEGVRSAAIEATPSAETVVALLACLAAGVTAVPLSPDAGPLERRHVLADSAAEVVLGRAADLALELPPGPEAIAVDASERAPLRAGELPEEQPAMILYTSGTTGMPKGVPVRAGAIASCLDGLASRWEWTADDLLVHGLPLFHVHGLVLGVLGPLRVGGRLLHTGRPTPAAYAEAAERGGTLFFAVPTIWSRIAADPPSARALRAARLLVSGSAALPRPVYDDLVAACGKGPVERYGMTETLITVAAPAAGPHRPGWVGFPLPGVETRLVGEQGEPVAADGESLGCLEVRGASVFAGYLNRPEATAEAFSPDGWMRTGDVACVGSDGWHRILGRSSTDLIKSGGYRIGAGEVEAALLSHPAVSEAAVVGEPDEDLGEAVVAYVVANGATAKELVDYVARELSAHKRPRRVELVEALPRNAMGKVTKALLGKPRG